MDLELVAATHVMRCLYTVGFGKEGIPVAGVSEEALFRQEALEAGLRL
jgi:hypothetical protein